jgi:glucosylceramidase
VISTASYTYVAEGWGVEDFNIDHDRQYRIPLIKQATAVAGKLTMYVPWSPAFMKTNGSMLQGGKLREFYQSWANYYAKFIKATRKKNSYMGNDDSKRTNGDPKMGVLYLYC